ncbi:MAG: hypothetical protein SF187_26580 [Deltaproteobacteria bacterium]|nr:hypothetical protein [Deltaproteobacteria bacterium]
MKLDIRTPIGGMFLVDGLVLMLYGLFGHPNMAQSQGTNINLWWGVVMTVFGGTMLGFALRARKSARHAAP